jgi:hypothetical protein
MFVVLKYVNALLHSGKSPNVAKLPQQFLTASVLFGVRDVSDKLGLQIVVLFIVVVVEYDCERLLILVSEMGHLLITYYYSMETGKLNTFLSSYMTVFSNETPTNNSLYRTTTSLPYTALA